MRPWEKALAWAAVTILATLLLVELAHWAAR